MTDKIKKSWIRRMFDYLGSFDWIGGRKFAGLQECFLLMYCRPEIAAWIFAAYSVYCGVNLARWKQEAPDVKGAAEP